MHLADESFDFLPLVVLYFYTAIGVAGCGIDGSVVRFIFSRLDRSGLGW